MPDNILDYRQDYLENIASEYVQDNKHQITSKKIAYVSGGQPGAGKSIILEKAKTELENKVIIINADDFRTDHPNYNAIVEKYGKESSIYTGKFAGNTAEKVLDLSIEQKQNIAIEGTFRTSEIPIRTLKKLKENGYETRVEIVTTDQNESYQNTINRYEQAINSEDKSIRMAARATPKNHHDMVVEHLPGNAKNVLESNLADSFIVSTKNGIIYDKDNALLNRNSVDEVIETATHDRQIRDEFKKDIAIKLDNELKNKIKLEDETISQKTLEDISSHADEIARGAWADDNSDEGYIDTENAELNTYLNNIKDPALRSRLLTTIKSHQKYADHIFDKSENISTKTLKKVNSTDADPVKYLKDISDKDIGNIETTKKYFQSKGYDTDALFISSGRQNGNYYGYVGEARDNCQMFVSKKTGHIFALDKNKLPADFEQKKGELVKIKAYGTPEVSVKTNSKQQVSASPSNSPSIG